MRNRGKQDGEKEQALWKQKTLHDYYDILVSQPEMEAKELALSLELFIGGSLNIFAHETNVDIDNRFLVYGIRDMGKELSAIYWKQDYGERKAGQSYMANCRRISYAFR